MAEVEVRSSFGSELKDAFKPVNAWVGGGIAWLDDIQNFYRERSVIEKEYSAKLAALAKKYYEKKAKKSSSLSVGDTPAMTPGSLESASLTTWTTQLTTLESTAAEHDRFSNELVNNVAEPVKILAARYDELRKKHVEYADKLEKERDSAYSDLKKTKTKYDGVCQEVENKRKKAEGGGNYGVSKAQNAYSAQITDMNNIKNTYLINIRVTNKQKEKYYHEYIPDLLDSMQDLHEFRTTKLNALWVTAAQLESAMLKRSDEFVCHLMTEIPRNLPALDTMMYLRHNVAPWSEPPDRVFEPSPVWLDDDRLITDDAAKVYLRNVLAKSKGQLGELKREVDTKRRELEATKRVKQAIRDGKDKRDEVGVVEAQFTQQEQLHILDHKRLTAEVESFAITAAVGDNASGAQSHNFKGQTFKIPTNCDYCGERIWGLSAKGFDCRHCGYTCHSKCEMKVPAECPGEQTKDERRRLKVERQEAANASSKRTSGPASGEASGDLPVLSRTDTMNSLSSGYAVSAHRSISGLPPKSPISEEAPPTGKISGGTIRKTPRILAPPPASYSNGNNSTSHSDGLPRGRMLYAYEANSDGELSISEGRDITIIEPDDGSGWTKVRSSAGSEGLVPASYLEVLPSSPAATDSYSARPASIYSNASHSSANSKTKKQGPAVAPKRGAKKLKYVEALYAYEAQSEAEHSMQEGDRFVLIKEDPGDGWIEVEMGGRVGSVPANYVTSV